MIEVSSEPHQSHAEESQYEWQSVSCIEVGVAKDNNCQGYHEGYNRRIEIMCSSGLMAVFTPPR